MEIFDKFTMKLQKKQKILGLKILGVIAGIAIIYAALNPVLWFFLNFSDRLEEWIPNSSWTLNAIEQVAKWGWDYFIQFIKFTLPLMWLPIFTYTVICLITTSRKWRLFFCLVILSFSILITKGSFNEAIANFSWSNIRGSLSELVEIYPFLIYIYLLSLLTIPRAFWNYVGAIIWLILSLLITLMPDLPGNLDDLGMISAIFGLIFLYINTVAYLVQRLVEPKIVKFLHRRAAKLLTRKQPIDIEFIKSIKSDDFYADTKHDDR